MNGIISMILQLTSNHPDHIFDSYLCWCMWFKFIYYNCEGFPEKAVEPHSSTLAWKIPWTEEPGGLQSMGSLRVRHDWATSLLLFTFMHWRRKLQPTPVFLPGESQGPGSLVGCRLWGLTESDNWSDLAAAAVAAVRASLIAQLVKNPPAMQETTVWFLSREDPRQDKLHTPLFLGFPCGSAGKESACNVGDLGSTPGFGRSPGEGKGYPLQYSGLENSMNCIVHGVTESDTTEQLSHSSFRAVSQEAGVSLVAQWIRIRLPAQGTRVQSSVWEDSTFCGQPSLLAPQLLSSCDTSIEAHTS